MEDRGIYQSIIERFSNEMGEDPKLGKSLSEKIIKHIKEKTAKKETLDNLEITLKTMKIRNEDS